MIVGILGTGRMGRALAAAVAAAGDQVLLASCRPAASGGGSGPGRGSGGGQLPAGCRTVPLAEIRRRAGLLLLALPFPVALEVMSGPAGLAGAGRTLIDVTNPGFAAGANLPPGRSGGELIAEAAASWQVGKAFNAVPAAALMARELAGRPVSVPVAGAPAAKVEAFALARRLGFEPVDAGDITASRELESLATLLTGISAAHGLHGRIAIHIGEPVHADGVVRDGVISDCRCPRYCALVARPDPDHRARSAAGTVAPPTARR